MILSRAAMSSCHEHDGSLSPFLNLPTQSVSQPLKKLLTDIHSTFRRDPIFDFRRLREDDLTAIELQCQAHNVLKILKEKVCLGCVLDEILLFTFPAFYLAFHDSDCLGPFLDEVAARCRQDVVFREELLEPPVPDDMIPARMTLFTEELDEFALRFFRRPALCRG